MVGNKMRMPRRLLILGCSDRKRLDAEPLPAVERYDGPPFRVLRKFLRHNQHEAHNLNVHILSAEWGLLPASELIPYYDRRMTLQRANELRSQVVAQVKYLGKQERYGHVCISAGKTYLCALSDYNTLAHADVTIPTGSLGRRLAMLHDWLYHISPTEQVPTDKVAIRGKVRLRGVEVAMTAAQVLDAARQALARGANGSATHQSWCVDIDGQHVAPKWLASQITGLPVKRFGSDEARRMLSQLGIKVVRYETRS